MMRLLLDTRIFLWWLADDLALPAKAREVIGNGNNVVYISAASVWEISVKKSLGKLAATENFEAIVEQERFQKLPITLGHGEAARQLPTYHRDPFDRMLRAQVRCEDLILVTVDQDIPRYQVQLLPLELSMML
ncbi:MAG: type II toxin-antitoxin system VapC family toxin [Desulfobulbaceae bacterium]|nr:type II toxin-antitoxin system VapC family toxin [Desulfobulbaceae bacterium]